MICSAPRSAAATFSSRLKYSQHYALSQKPVPSQCMLHIQGLWSYRTRSGLLSPPNLSNNGAKLRPTWDVAGSSMTKKLCHSLLRNYSLQPSPRRRRSSPVLHICAASTPSSSPSSEGGKGSRWDPLLANSDVGCPVPPEQQPVNEYSDLADALFFSWATMGPFNLSIRLAAIGFFFTLFLGWPIASASFDPQKQALQCVLSAVGGGLFPVMLATARLYLGWQYVGARLSSATVEYEETGWYDGQVWVKTPELLARDRLLASYRVKPVLKKLQSTLIGLGASLALIVTLVAFLPSYTPKLEARPFYFDDIEVDNEYFESIRAEEKTALKPGSVELFEANPEGSALSGSSTDSRDQKGTSAAMDLFKRLHSSEVLALDDSGATLEDMPEAMATITYNVQGYGFEYMVETPRQLFEEEDQDDALYTKKEANSVAGEGLDFANVTIIATRRQVVVESEDSYRVVPGTESLVITGSGVSSSKDKLTEKVRISDHLGVGNGGQLKVLKSLKPDLDMAPISP